MKLKKFIYFLILINSKLINTQCPLVQIPPTSTPTGLGSKSMAFSKDGNFAAVVNSQVSPGTIDTYSFNSSGVLQSLGAVQGGLITLFEGQFSTDSKIFAVTNSNNSISIFLVGNPFTFSNTVAIPGNGQNPLIVFSPTSQFAFVVSSDSATTGQIESYSVNTSVSPYLTASSVLNDPNIQLPTGFAISPLGNMLAVVDVTNTPGTLYIYPVNNLGIVGPAIITQVVGLSPVSVAFSPDGQIVAVVDSAPNDSMIRMYAINGGTLSLAATVQGNISQQINFSPTIFGFYYAAVANMGNPPTTPGDISVFLVIPNNPNPPTISQVTNSPIMLGTNNQMVSVAFSQLYLNNNLFFGFTNEDQTIPQSSVSIFQLVAPPILTSASPDNCGAITAVGAASSAAANVPVTIFVNNVASGTSTSQANGSYSVLSSSTFAPGTYSVSTTQTITTISGTCQSDPSINQPNVTVTVNQSPSANLTGATAICSGGSATLTLTITGTGPYNIMWSDGFTQTGVTSPVTRNVSPSSTTIYNAFVTDTSNGCTTTSNNQTVTVNTVSASLAGGTTICFGNSATLTLTITGTGSYNVMWSDGFSQSGVTSPVQRIVSPSSTTTYNAFVTDTSNGCTTTSNNQTIIVDTVIASLTGGTTICSGNSATLTLTISGTGPYNVMWSDGFSQTGVTSPVQRIVSPSSTTIYSATVTDANNCTRTSSQTTVTVDIVAANLTGGTTICSGNSATLTLTISGAGPYNVMWSDGFSQTGVTSPVQRTVSPNSTTTYSATVTDVNSCTSTSNNVTVTVNQTPAAPTLISATGNCAIVTVTGTAGANATITIFADNINIGTGNADSSGNVNLTSTIPVDNGTHSITITQTVNGCESNQSNAISVTTQSTLNSPTLSQAAANSSGIVTVIGTANADATIKVFADNSMLIGTGNSDSSGNFNFQTTTALSQGSHSITISQTIADCSSTQSNAITVNVSEEFVKIGKPKNGQTIHTNEPTFKGITEPFSKVTLQVFSSAVFTGSTIADANGHWSIKVTTPLTNGKHTAIVTAVDSAGARATDTIIFFVNAPIVCNPITDALTEKIRAKYQF